MNSDNLQHEWIYREYVNRENMLVHAPYEPEMDFYSLVASGRKKEVMKYLGEDFLSKEGLGILSDDKLRNAKYHFVITTASIARACINAGLSMEESYSLSDFYIQKADKLSSLSAITKLHDEMVLSYTDKMYRTKKDKAFSRPIAKCINYIYSNLHTKITLEALAEHVGLSTGYLSKLFKKETGCSLSSYIQLQKIETAKNMLLYSEYSSSEIAMILAFPSQSYFTEVFRKTVGVPPAKFRK